MAELEATLSNVASDFGATHGTGSGKLTFIEVLVKKGARKDFGRPKSTPIENKNAFMDFLAH